MLKSRIARIALTLMAAAGLTIGSAVANAATDPNPAFLSRDIYLATTSTGTAVLPAADNGTTTVSESGTYLWTVGFVGYPSSVGRDIVLDPGTYSWGCEVIGTGVSGLVGDNYEVTCWLNPSNPANPTAFLPSSSTDMWKIDLPAGNYTWQSVLAG